MFLFLLHVSDINLTAPSSWIPILFGSLNIIVKNVSAEVANKQQWESHGTGILKLGGDYWMGVCFCGSMQATVKEARCPRITLLAVSKCPLVHGYQ